MKTWIACIGMGFFLTGSQFLWWPASVSAADITFSPSIAISEEFTDNIFEVTNNKRSEFITRVQPGFSSRYQAPFWNWDMGYNFDYRRYERNSRDDDYTHNAVLKGNLTLLDNFLYLDVSDTYRRVTVDVSRNAATEPSLFLNQTDQNIAVISPYLLWRLRGDNSLRTGYRYTDVRYWGVGIDSREQGAFADLNHEVSSKFRLSAGYAFSHLESQPTQYNRHDLSGGFRYEYAERSFVFGQIGNTWQHFTNSADVSYLFWNAGVTHDLGFAVASFETRVQTAVDPLSVSTKETSYSGRLEKNMQGGMVGFTTSYSEFVDTETVGSERQRLSLGGYGRYEVMHNLTVNLAATGDRYSRQSAFDYPYRFTATGGLNYALKDNLAFGLTYSYVTNLLDLDISKSAREINRAIVEVRKTF